MKTNVQSTSIEAYHSLTAKDTQMERIARFIINETKHARWAWIGKVERELGMKINAVSARMCELKGNPAEGIPGGITIDGREYEMKFVKKLPDPKSGVTVQAFGLFLKAAPLGVQTELF